MSPATSHPGMSSCGMQQLEGSRQACRSISSVSEVYVDFRACMCEAPETYSIAPRARGEDAGVPWAVQPSAAALRSSTRCCETEPGLLLAKSASIEAYTFVVVVAPGASDRWSPHAPVRASKAARSYRLLLITCCVSCLAYILVTARKRRYLVRGDALCKSCRSSLSKAVKASRFSFSHLCSRRLLLRTGNADDEDFGMLLPQ